MDCDLRELDQSFRVEFSGLVVVIVDLSVVAYSEDIVLGRWAWDRAEALHLDIFDWIVELVISLLIVFDWAVEIVKVDVAVPTGGGESHVVFEPSDASYTVGVPDVLHALRTFICVVVINVDLFVCDTWSTSEHVTTVGKPDLFTVFDLQIGWFFCNLNLMRKDVAEINPVRMSN